MLKLGDSDDAIELFYTYDPANDNRNGRTIQQFSTQANILMKSLCGSTFCYYKDFDQFVEYYGTPHFGDQWVLAAAEGGNVSYSNGRGTDFGQLSSGGRAMAMVHGIFAYNIWPFVIRQMEAAIVACREMCMTEACQDDALQLWDEAVALYAGSLEGETGSGDGLLAYALADQRAREFKTTGYGSSGLEGASFVNKQLVRWFTSAQARLSKLSGDTGRQCAAVEDHKYKIVNLMKVPLIQSLLSIAWTRRYQSDDEEIMAQGATYAGSILPFVAACDGNGEDTAQINDFMKIGSKGRDIDYPKLKATLESYYKCLGVTCRQVGGLWKGNGYARGAEPCQGADDNTTTATTDTDSVFDPAPVHITTTTTTTTNNAMHHTGVVLMATLLLVTSTALIAMAARNLLRVKRRNRELEFLGPQNIAPRSQFTDVELS